MTHSFNTWFLDSEELWLHFDTAPDDSSLLAQAIRNACERHRFLPEIIVPVDWVAPTNCVDINRVHSFQDALLKRLATALRVECHTGGGTVRASPPTPAQAQARDPVAEGYAIAGTMRELWYDCSGHNNVSNWPSCFPNHDHATIKKNLTSLYCNVATATYEQPLSAQMATALDGFFRVQNCETIDYPPAYPSSGSLENDEVLATRLILNELDETLWPSILVSLAYDGDASVGRECLARHFEWPLTLITLLLGDSAVSSSYAPFTPPPKCQLEDWCYLYGLVQNHGGAVMYAHYMVWNDETACWGFASTLVPAHSEWGTAMQDKLGARTCYASMLATLQEHALRVQERIKDLLHERKHNLLLAHLNGSALKSRSFE